MQLPGRKSSVLGSKQPPPLFPVVSAVGKGSRVDHNSMISGPEAALHNLKKLKGSPIGILKSRNVDFGAKFG